MSRIPPLGFQGGLTTWGHPQAIPSAPRVPPVGRKSSIPGAARLGLTSIRDDHHYANLTDVAASVDVVSAKILDEPPGLRNFLMLRNTSATQTIYIGFGRDATSSSTLAIAAGQTVLFDVVVPQDDVFALSSAAGGSLSFAYSNIPE